MCLTADTRDPHLCLVMVSLVLNSWLPRLSNHQSYLDKEEWVGHILYALNDPKVAAMLIRN